MGSARRDSSTKSQRRQPKVRREAPPAAAEVLRHFDECLASDFWRHGQRAVAQLRMRNQERYLRLAFERLAADTKTASGGAFEQILRAMSDGRGDESAEVLD